MNTPPYDLPLFGTRYVFFKSLLNSDNPSLKAYGQHAQNQITSVGSLITSSGQDVTNVETKFYNMQSYIKFIEQMANAERAAEEAFFSQQLKLLKENNELELAQELESYQQGSTNDPNTYLLMINKLFQNSQEFEDNVSNAFTRIMSISKNLTQLGDEAKETLKKDFEESYDRYKKNLISQFQNLGKLQDTDYRDTKNINSVLTKHINSVIAEISKNPVFIQLLIDAFNKNPTLSDAEFQNIVIDTIVEEIINNPDNISESAAINIQKIVQKIISNIGNPTNGPESEYDKLFNMKSLQPIEEAALNLNTSISNIIIDLDDKSIKKLKNKYKKSATIIDDLLKANEKYKTNSSDDNYKALLQQKSRATEALRDQILKKIKIKRQDLLNKTKRKEYLQEIRDKQLITKVKLKQDLSTLLSHVSISHDAIAEAVTSNDAMKQIKNVVVGEIPGKKIQLKADIRFSVGYIDSNAHLIDDSSIKEIIDETITMFYKDFMEDYKAIGSNSTSVEAAMQAYIKQLMNMKNHIDQIVKSKNLPDESRKKLYDALYETFSTSVSVKDYDLYNNDLGVHGGALGPSSIPEGVIKNITKMYETGGITAIDVQKILFAVLNCGSEMVGSHIKTHLETYLLGGAALMMFDDGFANSEKFLEKITEELDGFRGQRLVHIYRVSNMYIPSSFILDSIAKNLQQVYFDILTDSFNESKLKQQNRVTIINNITEKVIPSYKEKPEPKDRWAEVSKTALSEVKITFSFMAGLLDILENFQKAINNVKQA